MLTFMHLNFSDGSRKTSPLNQTGQRANNPKNDDFLHVPPGSAFRANGASLSRLWNAKHHQKTLKKMPSLPN